jgi:hypothetical protein
MAAGRLQCWECGTTFYGRADAHYCCGACRQKAHRTRTRVRTGDARVPAPPLSDTVLQARLTRERSRAARSRAQAAQRASSAVRAKARRPPAN